MDNAKKQKEIRERLEMNNLLGDPKYARQAWRAIGQDLARRPCTMPHAILDKDGNQSIASLIEQISYESLLEDLKSLGKADDGTERKPTHLEMILQCQLIRARYDTAAAQFVRDTLGAKPVDESKWQGEISNPYESMTDDELEALQAYREKKAMEQQQHEQLQQPAATPDAQPQRTLGGQDGNT